MFRYLFGRAVIPCLAVLSLVTVMPTSTLAWQVNPDLFRHEIASSSRRSVSSTPASVSTSSLKQQVIDLVNVERRKAGLAPMTFNDRLEKAAQGHAEDMKSRNYFSHTTPEGVVFSTRIKNAGYPQKPCNCSYSTSYGENIARGQTTAQKVMTDWMNSPGHKKNILSSSFKEIGIGISGTYWVQDFGGVTIKSR